MTFDLVSFIIGLFIPISLFFIFLAIKEYVLFLIDKELKLKSLEEKEK